MMQQTATPLLATVLDLPGLTHGFFTRLGGVSTGVYASLNGGFGSRDDPRSVAENCRRMAAHLCVDPAHLLVPYQIHSPKALIVNQAFVERPRCDALVTSVRGLGLGVTGADCGMILFADRGARVIAAAHAGWKGALAGVLEATLAAMEELGARRASTVAALGPMISRNNYEVGVEFADRFIAASSSHARLFSPSPRDGHFMFDLAGLIATRLRLAGIGLFADLARDTYSEPENFYSYRRSVHRNEPDYGRQIAAIALV
jgi:polyphenol oxidase